MARFRTLAIAVLTMMLLSSVVAFSQQSQQPAPPPAKQKFQLAESAMRGYHGIERNLIEAAEKMPDADYSFKPTPDMRPFSQLVSHVALSQFFSCSRMKGQDNPHKDDKEENIKTKSDAVALLKASTALCDDAFSGINEQNFTEILVTPQVDVAKGLIVASTNSHGNEMYGTMAVYLRLKGLVPPTTERAEAAKKEADAKKASGK